MYIDITMENHHFISHVITIDPSSPTFLHGDTVDTVTLSRRNGKSVSRHRSSMRNAL